MTAIQNLETSRREKSSTHCVLLCVVATSTRTLFLLIFSSDQKSVSNCYFYRVLISTSVGLLLILWQRISLFSPWFYALLLARCALRSKVYFHKSRPSSFSINARCESKRKCKRSHYGNLSFGGRRPPYVVCGRRSFDSTLGFPGEGWQTAIQNLETPSRVRRIVFYSVLSLPLLLLIIFSYTYTRSETSE